MCACVCVYVLACVCVCVCVCSRRGREQGVAFASTALVVLTIGYLVGNGDCLTGFHETLSPPCNYTDLKKESLTQSLLSSVLLNRLLIDQGCFSSWNLP